MLQQKHPIKTLLASFFSLGLIALPVTVSADSINATNDNEGLELQDETRRTSTSLKPGVALSNYKNLQIADVSIAFKERWLRNYNRDQKSLSSRLKEKELEAIKARFAKQFAKSFTKDLEINSNYQIVTDATDNTLLIKPAIIDLVINAPYKATATNKHSMVRIAGKATLALEIYDAATGQLIGKLINKKETRDHHVLFRTNHITNNHEFIPVYKSWARNLRKVLK